MVSMLDVRRLVEERPGITLRDLAWHFRPVFGYRRQHSAKGSAAKAAS